MRELARAEWLLSLVNELLHQPAASLRGWSLFIQDRAGARRKNRSRRPHRCGLVTVGEQVGRVYMFQALRRELGANRGERLRYHGFDLLYLDGYDLRNAVYVERKRLLGRLLKDAPEAFVYVDYIQGDGDTIFKQVCQMGLEGIVAERRDAPYRSGRVDA
jgi:ATP-dependent DNA ligase